MKCTTCNADGATNFVSVVEPPDGEEPNVREAHCDGCLKAWEEHRDRPLFDLLQAHRDDAGALKVFRSFQDERRTA
jgi:hypothetical protein